MSCRIVQCGCNSSDTDSVTEEWETRLSVIKQWRYKNYKMKDCSLIGQMGSELIQTDEDVMAVMWLVVWLPWGSCGRTWCSRSFPSCSCSRSTRPSSGSTGCPWSWCGHRPWSSLSPPCRTDTCSGRRTGRGSHCCTHRNDPGSSSPRRRRSETETEELLSILYIWK